MTSFWQSDTTAGIWRELVFKRQNVQKRLAFFFSDRARSDIKLLRLSLSISFNLFRKHLNLFHICTLFVRLAAAQAVCLQLCMCRTSPSIHECLELFFTGTRGIH